MTDTTRDTEDLQAFRLRARQWLAQNMDKAKQGAGRPYEARWAEERVLQRKLYDAGFAGICFPKEYGGQGLSYDYQIAFDEESTGYDVPYCLDIPTFGIIGATLLEFGTEAQKKRYIPKMLSGEEIWVQMLSEPTGGSDLASVTTRATQDDKGFLVNGSKIWTSSCYAADFGLCVTRSNWDVPKHKGITVLILDLKQPGVTINRIVGVEGDDEFCQEFFDDVRVPLDNVVGEIGDGWTVVRGLLAHERNSLGGSSVFVSSKKLSAGRDTGGGKAPSLQYAIAAGATKDATVRQLVAEAHVLDIVQKQTVQRIATGMAKGRFSGHAGALLRLMGARASVRHSDIALQIAGSAAVACHPGDRLGKVGSRFIGRQGSELGGGSSEMQRNIIAERLLEMPREYAADSGIPFKDVRRNAMPGK